MDTVEATKKTQPLDVSYFISQIKKDNSVKDVFVNRKNGPVVEVLYGILLECIERKHTIPSKFTTVNYTILLDGISDSIATIRSTSNETAIKYITNEGIIVPKYHVVGKEKFLIKIDDDKSPTILKNGLIYENISVSDGPTNINIGSYVKLLGVIEKDSIKQKAEDFFPNASGIQVIKPPKTASMFNMKQAFEFLDVNKNETTQSFKVLLQRVMMNLVELPLYKLVEAHNTFSIFIPGNNILYTSEKDGIYVPSISEMIINGGMMAPNTNYPALTCNKLQYKPHAINDKKESHMKQTFSGKITSFNVDGTFEFVENEDVITVDCTRKVTISIRAGTGLTTESSKGMSGIYNYMYITDIQDWGYFTTINHPDMILICEKSGDEGTQQERNDNNEIELISHNVSAIKVCKPIGNIIPYLCTFGLYVDEEFTFELCHMLNDLDIITKTMVDDRESLLWHNDFKKEPSKDIRKNVLNGYEQNPSNTIGSELVNLKEYIGNAREFCTKNSCEFRVMLGKKQIMQNQNIYSMFDKPRFDGLSILNIIKYNINVENGDLKKIKFYNNLLIRIIFLFNMDANELNMYEEKKTDYIKKYYKYFDGVIKSEYKMVFGSDTTCPFVLADIKNDNFNVIKDLAFLPFAIKTTKKVEKKRKELDTIVEKVEVEKVEVPVKRSSKKQK